MKDDREPITVTLKLKPTRPTCDIVLAVRGILKQLLRVWGWRCVKVEWDEPGEGEGEIPNEG